MKSEKFKLNVKSKLLIMITMIVVGITIGQTNAFSQTSASIKPLEVIAKGPGALYFARLLDGIGFWVINEGKVRPVGTVKFVEGKRIPNSYIVRLANVRAVFYEDNLPLDYISQMKFAGKLENKNCPLCTVSMPFALQTPVEKRDKRYYEQILSFETRFNNLDYYEKLGNQMEKAIFNSTQ